MTNAIWRIDLELFAAPYCDAMLEKARQYVSDMNLTSEDVKIVKRAEQVLVITRRDIPYEITGQRGDNPVQDQAGGS